MTDRSSRCDSDHIGFVDHAEIDFTNYGQRAPCRSNSARVESIFGNGLFDELLPGWRRGLIGLHDSRLLLVRDEHAQVPSSELLQFVIERRQLPRHQRAKRYQWPLDGVDLRPEPIEVRKRHPPGAVAPSASKHRFQPAFPG